MKINNALIHNAIVEHIEFEDIKPQSIQVGDHFEFLIFELKKSMLLKDISTNKLILSCHIDFTSIFKDFSDTFYAVALNHKSPFGYDMIHIELFDSWDQAARNVEQKQLNLLLSPNAKDFL